uniref:C2H2-type domain-containing protein n=1 Tax=Guillardia theta TaxID=55529 RepID=A0A7S4NZY0_GUITH
MSVIPQSGHQIQMTVPQRLVWQRAFQAARKAGASVHEAQIVALRSAADGRVQPYVGDGEGREKTMCCTACQLEMPRSDISAHYKTPWHAFNTERKVLGLMPLPLAAFEQRVRSIEEGDRGQEEKEQNALQSEKARNELRHASKKNTKLAADIQRLYCLNETDHKVQEKLVFLEMRKLQAERLLDTKLGGLKSLEQNGTEDGGPDKADRGRRTGKKRPEKEKKKVLNPRNSRPVPLNSVKMETINFKQVCPELCPFDAHVSASLDQNLEHMRDVHGFIVPSPDKTKDVGQLVLYLVRKVYVGFACVFCGCSFPTYTAAQAHMESKGHRKLRTDDAWREEFSCFYNLGAAG